MTRIDESGAERGLSESRQDVELAVSGEPLARSDAQNDVTPPRITPAWR